MKPIASLLLLGFSLTLILVPGGIAQQKGPAEKLPFTDQQILEKVYDKAYKTPPGFYQDAALKDPNRSLYYHQPGWFATDKDKARKIVEEFLAKPSGIKVKTIEEASATRKFFDFRAGNIWFRVHNPDYFVPNGPRIDSGLPFLGGVSNAEVIGTLKLKPLSKEAVKDLVEYLWLIHFYNLDGAKVLQSEVKEQDGQIVATLYTTQVVYGDFGLSDEITVNRAIYRVDVKTGQVTHSQEQVRKLTGKKN